MERHKLKSLFYLIIFLFISQISFSQDITSGLVGYWPFNGNANDESGNGNNGIVHGAVLVNNRFGNSNSAYEFDGSDDYIDVGNNESFTLGGADYPMTLSIWINTREFGAGSNNGPVWMLNRFYVRVDGGPDMGLWGVAAGFSVTLDQWYHVAFTWDGTTLVPYANGVKLPSVSSTFTGGSLSNLFFGRRPNSNGYFNGLIDDIRIYNRALSEAEIQLLYTENASTPPPEPSLCQTIYCDGQNVGIGTPDTHGYKLAVAGDIITEEIKVATQPNWPDYVFQPEHEKPTLEELELYIQQNQKLPGIPSASEAESSGIELGEMNRLLLEKIEELTLYVIEQDRNNKKLQTDIYELQKNNTKMKKEIAKLKSNQP